MDGGNENGGAEDGRQEDCCEECCCEECGCNDGCGVECNDGSNGDGCDHRDGMEKGTVQFSAKV